MDQARIPKPGCLAMDTTWQNETWSVKNHLAPKLISLS